MSTYVVGDVEKELVSFMRFYYIHTRIQNLRRILLGITIYDNAPKHDFTYHMKVLNLRGRDTYDDMLYEKYIRR